jgi:hypothetical protein
MLRNLLTQLPIADALLSEQIPMYEEFEVKVWTFDQVEHELEKWRALFNHLPGYNICPFSYFVDGDEPEFVRKRLIIVAQFAPNMAYIEERDVSFKVYLKDDGTATFYLPTLEDAEQFPELYYFKGSWKEAYLLLIETLQKGWPMEEFPEELQKFLPKQ